MKEIQDLSLESDNESGEEGEEDEVSKTQQQQQQQQQQQRFVLQFLDSSDDYLNLLDGLSSTLRQGWIDLASARHSMGTSRVSTALLDLKIHSADTSLRVDERDDGSIESQPFINLQKWTSNEDGDCLGEDKNCDKFQRKFDSSQLRQRNISELSEDNLGKSSIKKEGALIIDDQVQKERSRMLSTFGTLVSPKLRSAQLSFENALEIIVEIANKRIAILSSFEQVKKGLEDTSSLKQVKEEQDGTET